MEYEESPHWRVDYDKVAQLFHLYADGCILASEEMIEKIRKDLHLPTEIEICPDDLYQCAKCLGLSAGDVGC